MSQSHAGPSIFSKAKVGKGALSYNKDHSSDDEPRLYEVRMRVGEMYQAVVPNWEESSKQVDGKDGMRIWSPNHTISDEDLTEYCRIALGKHGYNMEQALGMLLWHKYDITKSLQDMANFTPMPDDWTNEEKELFSLAYQMHGKCFRKIQQLLPGKHISQLVKYYYLWKKSQVKSSLMDRQAKQILAIKNEHNLSDEDVIHMDGKDSNDSTKKTAKNLQTIQKLSEDALTRENIEKIINCNGEEYDNEIQNIQNKIGSLKKELTKQSKQDWTEQEMLLIVEGVRKYGRDFVAISKMIKTKSVKQIEEFCSVQHSNLSLNQVYREYQENLRNGGRNNISISSW